MNPIQQLQQQRLVWSGFEHYQGASTLASDYPELDEKLAGGLPEYGVVELKSALGIGELRLLLPYLKRKQTEGMLVFITPPSQLAAEFLASQGLQLQQLLVIKDCDGQEALWAAEQCLKSGCCASVVLWHNQVDIKQARRLQLACDKTHSSLLLFQTRDFQGLADSHFALPSTMRLRLTPDELGLQVKVEKQKGGTPIEPFLVNFQQDWPDLVTQLPSSDKLVAFPKVQQKN